MTTAATSNFRIRHLPNWTKTGAKPNTAASGLLNLSALGIAVVVAMLLNLLIVQPVLLPAAEVLLGRWGWWPTVPGRPGWTAHERRPVLAAHRRPRSAHP